MKLIENEISLGFTFFQTFTIAGSKDHADQALRNARRAHETALKFLDRLPAESFPDLRTRLNDLGNLVLYGR